MMMVKMTDMPLGMAVSSGRSHMVLYRDSDALSVEDLWSLLVFAPSSKRVNCCRYLSSTEVF